MVSNRARGASAAPKAAVAEVAGDMDDIFVVDTTGDKAGSAAGEEGKKKKKQKKKQRKGDKAKGGGERAAATTHEAEWERILFGASANDVEDSEDRGGDDAEATFPLVTRGGESETSTVALATVATYCFRATRHLLSTMRASLRSNASKRRTSHDSTAETASAFVVGGGDAGASASKSREASSNVSSTTGVRGDSNAAQRMTSNAASASRIGSRTGVALTFSRPA